MGVLACNRQGCCSQRAFSLIEAVIVLSIVAMVLGGIWAAASTVRENLTINETMTGILTTAENIRTTLSAGDAANLPIINPGAGGYRDLTVLCTDGGAAPRTWIKSSLLMQDTEGSRFTCTLNQSATEIQLSLYSLSRSRCVKLTTAISGRFKNNTYLTNMVVTGSDGTNHFYSAFPLNASGTQCSWNTPLRIDFKFSFARN